MATKINPYRNKPYQVEFLQNTNIGVWASPIKVTIILDEQMEADEFDGILHNLFADGKITSAFGGPNDIEL